jgi:hypothetical protein
VRSNLRFIHSLWRKGARCCRNARPRPALLALLLGLGLLSTPAAPQYDFNDEPLLASPISTQDVQMYGRWVRQWRDDAGTLVLMFNGGFRLELGQRRLSCNNAIVWLEPGVHEPDHRKYYELTIYLSENAEVREPAGTVTQDSVLLVRGIRTFGRIIKYQDAYAPESMALSPLYQQALRDRLATEAAEAAPATGADVTHPATTPASVARPQRVIRYRLPNIEPARTAANEPVFVATGGVYFAQDGGPDTPLLEIRAVSAVVFPAENASQALLGAAERQTTSAPATQPAGPGNGVAARRIGEQPEKPAGGAFGFGGDTQDRVRAVYLEGDVVLSRGDRFVRATRLYYDFEHDRALILDAVLRADIPQRDIPLYIRADEMRQLSAREYSARHALVTTSEFYTPSYHVGAEQVYIRDLTPRDATGQNSAPLTGEYELRDSTLQVGGVPIAWWPYSKGRLESSETLIRRLRTGYSGRFGYEFESGWYLFNLLGITPPAGVDATLRLDYFSRRGPGVGINVDYSRETNYGFLRTYLMYDQGEDTLGPLRRYEEQPDSEARGRALWRHRHYLPYDWEVTLEAAYISDPYFLEEYEKDEWFEGKEQETLIYLKRAKGVEALTFLANWRTLDFLTQTEHLPDATYRRIGDTLGPVVLYNESRVGAVRRELDDRHFVDKYRWSNFGGTDVTFRADVREEAEAPLKAGPVSLVPFSSVRGSYWDGQPLDDGGLWRGLGVYGVRGGTSFSKVFDNVESELFDVHRIRHIVKPDFAVWWSNSNTRSERISPFDYGIETVDAFYGATAGVRQAWQTKRGLAELRRTVDLLTLNLEVGAFGNTEGRHDISNGYANPYRPENSRTRNYFAGDLMYRLSDTTSLLYDFNLDLNDRSYDKHDVALAIERSPRLAYVLGSRYAGDIDMSLVGGGWNYKLNEKHLTAVRAWWDVDSGRLGEFTLGYIRKLPRWYAGVSFEYDNVSDDFSINFSLWPEGVPEWSLGSRRFTNLGAGTGIRP